MTTIGEVEETCAVCGSTNVYRVVNSTNQFGSQDLDTRPPEMMRSTMPMWVQRCPSCGYCAPQVDESHPNAAGIIHSELYQEQLNDSEFPELANTFLCWSQIQENADEFAVAGWSSLRAAWACDDHKNDLAGQKCRRRAIALWLLAKENAQSYAQDGDVEDALMVDVLRRSGQFEAALKVCDEALTKTLPPIISSLLNFQKKLIQQSDTARHSISEAQP